MSLFASDDITKGVLAAKGGPTSHWSLWIRNGTSLKITCDSKQGSEYFGNIVYGPWKNELVSPVFNTLCRSYGKAACTVGFCVNKTILEMYTVSEHLITLQGAKETAKKSTWETVWTLRDASGFCYRLIAFININLQILLQVLVTEGEVCVEHLAGGVESKIFTSSQCLFFSFHLLSDSVGVNAAVQAFNTGNTVNCIKKICVL